MPLVDGPAMIGVLAVALFQLAPHALPDPFAIAILVVTVVALLKWRTGAVKLMIAGSILSVLRSRALAFPWVSALKTIFFA
jgi:chromate transport protein ChrA